MILKGLVNFLYVMFGGGTILSSIHLATAEVIKDETGNKRWLPLKQENSKEWKILLNKLKVSKDGEYLKSDLFELREKAKKDNKEENWIFLGKWCDSNVNSVYSSALQEIRPFLKKNVIDYCFLSLWEKLVNEKISLAKERKQLSIGFQISLGGIKKDNPNDPELQKIKENSNATTALDDLFKWCINSFKQGFISQEENLYKWTKSYCVDSSLK